MAYRVIFWRPRSGINIWLPADRPLGETIRDGIFGGHISELLNNFPAQNMFQRLKSVFPESQIDEAGYLQWCDEIDNGFVVRYGEQFVEVCVFNLADEDLDKIFSVAAECACEWYDWGN